MVAAWGHSNNPVRQKAIVQFIKHFLTLITWANQHDFQFVGKVVIKGKDRAGHTSTLAGQLIRNRFETFKKLSEQTDQEKALQTMFAGYADQVKQRMEPYLKKLKR